MGTFRTSLVHLLVTLLLICSCNTQDAGEMLQMTVSGILERQMTLITKFDEQQAKIDSLITLMEEHKQELKDLQDMMEKDECLEGTHNCNAAAVCTDRLIHYQCNCKPGYSGDGVSCQDIDECLNGSICSDLASCSNQPGSYQCNCVDGYTREGNICQDVDECISGTNTCDETEDCINQPGSYICNCKSGLKREGNKCQGCDPPAKFGEGLGCIIAVAEKMSWQAAQDNCQSNGGRLLEGFEKEHYMVILELFPHFKDKSVWVGVQNWQWATLDTPLNENMWRTGEPDRGDQNCGYFYLSPFSIPGLHDWGCSSSNTLASLCQLI